MPNALDPEPIITATALEDARATLVELESWLASLHPMASRTARLERVRQALHNIAAAQRLRVDGGR